MIKYTFHKRLREARKYAKLRQIDVANMAKISCATYNRYEAGEILPTIDKLFDFCRVLNCPVGWLVGECYVEEESTTPPWEHK